MAEAIVYEELPCKYESCHHCSGFYGPSFGEPLCATCHAFLCPPDPFGRDAPIRLCDLKVDECDSGNEEPRDSQQDCAPAQRDATNDALQRGVAATFSKYFADQRVEQLVEAEVGFRCLKIAKPVQNVAGGGACGGGPPPARDGAHAVVFNGGKVASGSNGAPSFHHQGRKKRRACAQGSDSSNSDSDSQNSVPQQEPLVYNGFDEASGYNKDHEDNGNMMHRRNGRNNPNDLSDIPMGPFLHRRSLASREDEFNWKRDRFEEGNSSRPVEPRTLYKLLGVESTRSQMNIRDGIAMDDAMVKCFNNMSLKDIIQGILGNRLDQNIEAANIIHSDVWQRLYKTAQKSHGYENCPTQQSLMDQMREKLCPRMPRSNSLEVLPTCSCSSSQTGHLLQEQLCLLTNPVRYNDTEPSTLAGRMPPEVWIMVFRLLDDVSLWQCTRVSTAWRHLVLSNWGQNSWQRFTNNRWRFFKPIFSPVYWYAIYSSLLESSPCRPCQSQRLQPLDPATLVEQNSWRMTRLVNEKKSLAIDPPEGIEAIPLEPQLLHWQASIRGPDKSPYMGGTFYLHILIPPRYPLGPPVVRFFTKIFHPNVSCHGDIGIDSIQHNWSLALTISKVLISIQSLLTDPFTTVCMDPYAGRLYDTDRAKFEKIAREWTWRYAMPDALHPHPCQDELRLCEAATEGYDESVLDDLSSIMDDQDNNDNDQDENDQENNDVYIENNDPEEANMIMEPLVNNPPELEGNLNIVPVPANVVEHPQAINPALEGNLNNLPVQVNVVEQPQAINPALEGNLNNLPVQVNVVEQPQAINPALEGNLNNLPVQANVVEQP